MSRKDGKGGRAFAGLPQAEEITLTTADSERLVAWHVAPRSDRPVILYLQGNGGSLRHRVHRFARLVQDGFGVFAVSYRGFGGSTGSPSETGLLLDAAAGYAFCADRYGAERIVVWGELLGSGVAVALAGKHLVGRLILEAPFTSAADVARLSYPLIPVGLLMKDQFRSDARIGAITVPTLVLHGELDRVVPIAFGERLYAAIRAPKRFVRFAKGEHEGLDAHGAIAAVRRLLNCCADRSRLTVPVRSRPECASNSTRVGRRHGGRQVLGLRDGSAQAACCFIPATYRSIHPWRNCRLIAPMLPSASNSPSFAWIKASGWPSVGTSRYARMVRRCC